MRYRTLGRTGLKVSEIGFGAWAIGGNDRGNSYGPTDDATSIAAVRRAVELGCTFFDTADVYGWGHSEEVLGQALEGRPATLQIPFSVLRQEWIGEPLAEARKANIGIIAREPLANGFLAGKIPPSARFPPGDIRHHWPTSMIAARSAAADTLSFLRHDGRTLAQAALRFVLSFPEVSTAIPGCKTPAQVEEDLGASDAPPLVKEEIDRVRQVYGTDVSS